ncbi:MAG: tetratricopeptide repeat protein, partial [Gemmataceae bacterium]
MAAFLSNAMMTQQINYRLLLLLLAELTLGIGVAFLVHAGQMHRHARTLMAQARQAESEGRLKEEIHALRRYLVFAPEDNDARARCGEIMEQLAASEHERWRVVEVYQQVLYLEPSRRHIRDRLARLSLRLGWTSEARAHLEILLREQPNQGDLECLLGQCQDQAGEYARAAASYEDAIRDDPRQLEAYLRLALLYQYRLDQPEKAGRVFDDLVRNNSGSSEAYLARAIQGMTHGSLPAADRDLQRARELAPEDAHVLLAAAELERRRGRLSEARRFLRQGRAHEPSNLTMHINLAALERESGRPRDAVACLRQGLQALPDQPDLMLLLTEALLDVGEEAEAEEVIQRLRRPGSPPGLAHYLNGRLQMHRKLWMQAIHTLEEVVQAADRAPSLASRASLFLCRCCERGGDSAGQLAALRQAVALDKSSAPARMALAEALQRNGRIDEALEQYREVVTMGQAPEESWVLLGRLLVQRIRSLPARKRRWSEVEKVLERAAHFPTLQVPLTVLRAEVLREQGKAEQARKLLEKTSAAHADALELWIALADLALRQGEPERALQVLEQARKRLSNRRELYEAEITLAVGWTSQPVLDGLGSPSYRLQAKRILRKLENERDHLPAKEQLSLLGQLATAYFRLGEAEEGRRLCRLLAEQAPAELSSRLAVLDLAVQGGDETLLARLTADVRRLEGEEGIWWRYGEAARLLLKAQRGERVAGPTRERVRALVAELVRRRPDWPRGALLEASLHELEG